MLAHIMKDKDLCKALENIYRILRSFRLTQLLSTDHEDLVDREMLKLLELIEGMGGGVD
jgi:hypothetical protein